MPLFVLFWVDFHSARLFFAYYVVFFHFLGNFWGWGGVGDDLWENFFFLHFMRFCYFGCFLTFWGYFIVGWGVLANNLIFFSFF